MRRPARGFVFAVLGAGAILTACSNFQEEPANGDGGDADVAPDTSLAADTAAPPTDAGVDASPCLPDETDAGGVVLQPAARDGVLDMAQEDAGSRKLCDLATSTCILAFDLGVSSGRRISSVSLTLRRAVGADCQMPADCGLHRGQGTVFAAQMSAD